MKIRKFYQWLSPKTHKIFLMITGEIIGTAMLMFMGCSGNIWFRGEPSAIASSLNFGFVVMMIVIIYGHLSVAILNPVFAIAGVVNNKFSWQMGIAYVFAELFGACLGYGVLTMTAPSNVFILGTTDGMCLTLVNSQLSVTQAFLIEFIITSALVAVVCAVWDSRTEDFLNAVKIGLSVATISMTFGGMTGASMNPARSFAPALYNGNWEHHWIYWVAPLSGGLLTSVGYKYFFYNDENEVKS